MPSRPRWLSLTSTISESEPRWFTPPPARTAAFSSARSPGRVLRVSQIRARLPGASAPASTKRRVKVATPERWHRKFSAVRSAVRIDASGPSTVPMTVARLDRVAVGARQLHDDRAVDLRNASVAQVVPASTPRLRGTKDARPVLTGIEEGSGDVAERPEVLCECAGHRVADDAREQRRSSQHEAHAQRLVELGEVGARVGAPALLANSGRGEDAAGRRSRGCGSRRLRHRSTPQRASPSPRRRRPRSRRGCRRCAALRLRSSSRAAAAPARSATHSWPALGPRCRHRERHLDRRGRR